MKGRSQRTLLHIASASLLLAAMAGGPAKAQEGPQPPPDVGLSISSDRQYGFTLFHPSLDGCWDESSQSYDDFGSPEEEYCASYRGALYKKGRFVRRVAKEYEYDDDFASFKGLDWRCSMRGRYEFRMTYTNDSYSPPDSGGTYRAVVKRRFTLPRCRKPKPRLVGRGTAASAADEESPDAEFTSRIRCRPVTAVRAGKASGWSCDVTHNNNYRECTSVARLSFYSKNKWGARERSYEASFERRSCRYF